jgi:hypothetical protein
MIIDWHTELASLLAFVEGMWMMFLIGILRDTYRETEEYASKTKIGKFLKWIRLV